MGLSRFRAGFKCGSLRSIAAEMDLDGGRNTMCTLLLWFLFPGLRRLQADVFRSTKACLARALKKLADSSGLPNPTRTLGRRGMPQCGRQTAGETPSTQTATVSTYSGLTTAISGTRMVGIPWLFASLVA